MPTLNTYTLLESFKNEKSLNLPTDVQDGWEGKRRLTYGP